MMVPTFLSHLLDTEIDFIQPVVRERESETPAVAPRCDLLFVYYGEDVTEAVYFWRAV